MDHKNKKFENETIQLDGNNFKGCEFTGCTVEYSGGTIPSMSGCNFGDSQWSFKGPAGNTVAFMSSMYHGGFKSVIEQTFDNIKTLPAQASEGNPGATDSETTEISIRCQHCRAWFPSPIFMTPRSTFDTATLFNNRAQCGSCGKMTACDKENFRARFEDGGFMGSST